MRFTLSIRIGPDSCLDRVQPHHHIIFLCAFASAVIHGECRGPGHINLLKGTVKETYDQMASCVRSCLRTDSRLYAKVTLHPICTRQLRGSKEVDRPEKQQRDLPAWFFHEAFNQASIPRQIAISPLIILAYFFLMRCCD